MEISSEYLAELLIGIARSQNAIVDAMDRASPGFRNSHLISQLNVAANIRSADPRLVDLPARVLLRMQGRVAIDAAAVVADLERLASAPAAAASPDAPTAVAPAVARAAARAAAAAPAVAPAAPAAGPAAAPAAPAAAAPRPAASGGEDLDFSAKP